MLRSWESAFAEFKILKFSPGENPRDPGYRLGLTRYYDISFPKVEVTLMLALKIFYNLRSCP